MKLKKRSDLEDTIIATDGWWKVVICNCMVSVEFGLNDAQWGCSKLEYYDGYGSVWAKRLRERWVVSINSRGNAEGVE